MERKPDLIVFWGDSREPLTHAERLALVNSSMVQSVTPSEVLLRHNHRLVVVRWVGDAASPRPPMPRG